MTHHFSSSRFISFFASIINLSRWNRCLQVLVHSVAFLGIQTTVFQKLQSHQSTLQHKYLLHISPRIPNFIPFCSSLLLPCCGQHQPSLFFHWQQCPSAYEGMSPVHSHSSPATTTLQNIFNSRKHHYISGMQALYVHHHHFSYLGEATQEWR